MRCKLTRSTMCKQDDAIDSRRRTSGKTSMTSMEIKHSNGRTPRRMGMTGAANSLRPLTLASNVHEALLCLIVIVERVPRFIMRKHGRSCRQATVSRLDSMGTVLIRHAAANKLLPRFTQSIINPDGSRPITHTGTCTHVRVLHIFSTTLKGRHHE